MTFDPFGDFEAKGYLRNLEGEKDRAFAPDGLIIVAHREAG